MQSHTSVYLRFSARLRPVVLIDGIRGDAEVTMFRKVFPGFTLISIDSSFETRLARIRARGRSDDFESADRTPYPRDIA